MGWQFGKKAAWKGRFFYARKGKTVFFRGKTVQIQRLLFLFIFTIKSLNPLIKGLKTNLYLFFFHNRLFLSLLALGIIKMFVMSNEDNAGECIGQQIWDN